jgi:hypothetical protein
VGAAVVGAAVVFGEAVVLGEAVVEISSSSLFPINKTIPIILEDMNNRQIQIIISIV